MMQEQLKLHELKPHLEAKIKAIHASGRVLQKLYDMGFIEGMPVRLVRFSPLKDPIQVQLLNYHITLRVEEARCIEVYYV